MNTYLVIKWLHIVSSVLLVGTGFGSAFYLFFAHRSRSVAAIAVVSRLVVRADNWFTAPTAVIQPLTGLALVHLAGWPLATPWLAASLVLFCMAGGAWLPVLWLQWRMAEMAEAAHRLGQPLPERHARYMRRWEALGYLGFTASLAIFYLMVNKPALW